MIGDVPFVFAVLGVIWEVGCPIRVTCLKLKNFGSSEVAKLAEWIKDLYIYVFIFSSSHSASRSRKKIQSIKVHILYAPL